MKLRNPCKLNGMVLLLVQISLMGNVEATTMSLGLATSVSISTSSIDVSNESDGAPWSPVALIVGLLLGAAITMLCVGLVVAVKIRRKRTVDPDRDSMMDEPAFFGQDDLSAEDAEEPGGALIAMDPLYAHINDSSNMPSWSNTPKSLESYDDEPPSSYEDQATILGAYKKLVQISRNEGLSTRKVDDDERSIKTNDTKSYTGFPDDGRSMKSVKSTTDNKSLGNKSFGGLTSDSLSIGAESFRSVDEFLQWESFKSRNTSISSKVEEAEVVNNSSDTTSLDSNLGEDNYLSLGRASPDNNIRMPLTRRNSSSSVAGAERKVMAGLKI
eukprot:m.345796 g.345796  ORF g.345796 m.345796 type:complete len:328 (+) comp27339_c0_seq1:333-1316(+)